MRLTLNRMSPGSKISLSLVLVLTIAFGTMHWSAKLTEIPLLINAALWIITLFSFPLALAWFGAAQPVSSEAECLGFVLAVVADCYIWGYCLAWLFNRRTPNLPQPQSGSPLGGSGSGRVVK
jgi:hypothetical protein